MRTFTRTVVFFLVLGMLATSVANVQTSNPPVSTVNPTFSEQDKEAAKKVADAESGTEVFAAIMQAGKPVQQLAENCYKVVVNHGQSLKEMIAAGKYDYVNSDITADNFPIQLQGSGQQSIVIELVHFGRDMESEAVLKEFEARGLRAATFPELLAFGSTYPEKQREFPIVALGSMRLVHDDRYIPYLDRWLAKRGLNLNWFVDRWHPRCRFAAVRK